MSEVKMVITDLDGTLLQQDHTISQTDYTTLLELGKRRILRIAATGRNLAKVKQVIHTEAPFDYIIFSSGAGIINWKSKKLLRAKSIQANEAQRLTLFLINKGVNFKISKEIPDNHNFAWWKSSDCPEFDRYIEYNNKHGEAAVINPSETYAISQALVFLPGNDNHFNQLKEIILNSFPHLSIIRATSPLNPKFTWLEIFPEGISKADGIDAICALTGIHPENTLSIGNDFNDVEMLEYTRHAYVVENAPKELKNRFVNCRAHHNDGFTHAVMRHLV